MNDFFGHLPAAPVSQRGRLDIDTLHRLGCKVCPLASAPNKFLDMKPAGSAKALVYLLGEFPNTSDLEDNDHFAGDVGRILRARIPRDWKKDIRFNNVVRSHPAYNVDPEQRAIECCRPSIVKDIELTKPVAIFGFGSIPLEWVMGPTLQSISNWRGRRMPVKVGNHTCWYYPMLDPAHLLKQQGTRGMSEDERMFAFDLKRAFAEVEWLPQPRVHTPQDVFTGIECISEGGSEGLQRVRAALDWAMGEPCIGIDYETDGLRPYRAGARVLTGAIASGDKGYAFPFKHPESEWTAKEFGKLWSLWVDFLMEYKGVKFVHNLAFELEWSAVHFNQDVIRAGKWEDSSVQASILDERKGRNKPGCFSLEFLVQQHFGVNLKRQSNLDRANLANEPMELVLRYNGGDSKYHCLLGLVQQELLKKEGLTHVYVEALRRVPTVVFSQLKGVPLDNAETTRLQDKYDARIAKLEAAIRALPIHQEFEKQKGFKFNPRSDKDVLYVFKDMLNRDEVKIYDKKKRKDRFSCDEDVLKQIDHPLANLILTLRKASRQRSTYIDPLDPTDEETVVHPDGLVHATFNTIFAETGRLSCEDPNLQNFPARDGEAKEVRKQIKAPPDCVMLAADYGQIEARCIAMFTKDPLYVKALWENYDVHTEWAERLARAYPRRIGGKKNLTDKGVMADFRTDIKNQWTFPLFFGATVQSAAGYLNIPEEVLAPEFNRFWRVFAATKVWQGEQLEFYHKHGYVECLTGRRRRGPLSSNKVYNSPVQGTAAEIVMNGMSRLSEIGDPDLQPEINIHDDLTYCRMPLNRVDELAERVITEMIDVPFDFINVPISIEVKIGGDWLNMKKFGTFSSDTWFKGVGNG